MSSLVLKGKPVANSIKKITEEMIAADELKPTLAVIIVGHDPASEYYVENIAKQGEKLGIAVILKKFESIDLAGLIHEIKQCNENDNISAIMIQKPLPKNIDEKVINSIISPDKDVDGLNPLNAGNLYLGQECFIPCTAESVLEIIKFYGIQTQSKHIVVVGRSNVIGKPIANLFLHKSPTGDATVTVCHSKTKNIENYTKQADILVTAVGRPNMIKKEMIKENCVIIDAGINEISKENDKNTFVGDVDYQDCLDKCEAITPVPGGVGSVTTTVLLHHVVRSAKKIKKKE